MAPKKALVVDDSRSARYSLRKTLERLNLSVDCVESGETALNYLQEAQESLPDVIFMDNLMPGMNGFSTSETINKNQSWKHIPVIMCTATQGSQNLAAAKHCGAAGLLPKPATTSQIQKLLEQLADGTYDKQQLFPTETTSGEHTAESLPPSLLGGEIIHEGHILANLEASEQNVHEPVLLNQNTQKADSDQNNTDEQTLAPNPTSAQHSQTTQENQLQTTTPNAVAPNQPNTANTRQEALKRIEALENSMSQWTQELEKQVSEHIQTIIQDTLAHPTDNPVAEKARFGLAQLMAEKLHEKISPIKQEIEEKLESQARGIEHRLMGEALNNEQVIEQAVSAASVAAQSAIAKAQEDSPISDVMLQEIEQIARLNAEKAVSDNIQRIQSQISQSVQVQIASSTKRQTLLSMASIGLATIALALVILN